jgi:tetratricopeptide (TPR) repeat protein
MGPAFPPTPAGPTLLAMSDSTDKAPSSPPPPDPPPSQAPLPHDPPANASPAAESTEPRAKSENGRAGFDLDVTGDSAAEAVARLKENVAYWVARGRYQKVRIKRGGKAILPDIPIGALVAVEAATFFWTGLLRAALVNVVGRAFFEVELINEAEGPYKKGLAFLLAGDVDDAETSFQKALAIDERFAKAHLQMGVVRKIRGDKDAALAHFERVLELDRHSDAGREAKAHLHRLKG